MWHAQVGDGQYLDGWEIVYILNLLDKRISLVKDSIMSSDPDAKYSEVEYANDIRNKLQMATLGELPPVKLEIKT